MKKDLPHKCYNQTNGSGGFPAAESRQHRTNPDEAAPNDKDQRNVSEPNSKIMKTSKKGLNECGNAQIVTTEDQVILAANVRNQANDVRQIESMVEQLQASVAAAKLEGAVKEFIADP